MLDGKNNSRCMFAEHGFKTEIACNTKETLITLPHLYVLEIKDEGRIQFLLSHKVRVLCL